MSFSLLLPVYYKDHPEYLRTSLESILNQVLQVDELVLIKDGPIGTELEEIIALYEKKFDSVKIVSLDENVGLGRALNIGLKHCSFDLVARMDADDIAKPDRFLKQVKFMQLHPEIDICSSWVDEFVKDVTHIVSIRKVPKTHEEISQFIKVRSPINHPAVIFRKTAVEKAGGYKHFPLFEDWYLWARMMVNGCRFANIQESLLYFRTSPDMFRRRGGWNYAKDCVKFQWELHKIKLISVSQAIQSSMIRGFVYLLPNKIRKIIYMRLLR